MDYSDYWKECIAESLDEVGLIATDEQIAIIAANVEGSHENYGTAFGHDCIPDPLRTENDNLKQALEKEQSKVVCPECRGRGCITENCGPVRSSTSQCWTCRGEGKVLP